MVNRCKCKSYLSPSYLSLLGKIQSLKHGIPKGDKKRKKEMTIKIAELQAHLDFAHEVELKNVCKL